jgi:hypothetical protein
VVKPATTVISLSVFMRLALAPGKEKQLIISQADLPIEGQSHLGHHDVGHAHFWERAMLSRRQFIRTSVGATGAVLSSALWIPAVAHASGGAQVPPIPIPGGVAPGIHVFLPGHGAEPSTIFDFNGFIGVAHLTGTGTGTDTTTGATTPLLFDIDNRFMKGVYVGVDGKKHRGTFGFV